MNRVLGRTLKRHNAQRLSTYGRPFTTEICNGKRLFKLGWIQVGDVVAASAALLFSH